MERGPLHPPRKLPEETARHNEADQQRNRQASKEDDPALLQLRARLGDDERAEGVAPERDRIRGRGVRAVRPGGGELEGLHLTGIESRLVEERERKLAEPGLLAGEDL